MSLAGPIRPLLLVTAVTSSFLFTPPGSGCLGAQATALLPPLDPVHRELERLAAWGLVDTLFVGQRPWSRTRALSLARQARRNLHRLDDAALAETARTTLERVEDRLAPRPSRGTWRPVADGARIDLTWSDSPFRSIPSNGLGSSSAGVNPLLAYEQGREHVRGTTLGLEAGVRLEPARWWTAVFRPRARLTLPSGNATRVDGQVQEAYARFVGGNAVVTAGMAPVVWGQGLRGGLLLSHNPRPLLRVGVATEHPVVLPWLLGTLGPGLHELFWADLGTEGRAFPHAFLLGARSSFRPHPRLEVGVAFLNQQGGEGAPGATVLERIADALIVPDLFMSSSDFVFSQKMAQVDLRLGIPGTHGLEVWLEWVVDDFDVRRPASVLRDDSGWTLGVRLARLDPAGRAGLTLQGQRTGLRFYAHRDFSGGMTVGRRTLGSELGTDADGLLARFEWRPGPDDELLFDAALERRSNDRYVLFADEPPHGFVRTRSLPEESRLRFVATWIHRVQSGWSMRNELGWERSTDFAFVDGVDRTFWLLRVVTAWRGG